MIKKMKKNKKGFTLIELIVVIAIIAILAAVAIPNYMSLRSDAEAAAARGNAAVIAGAINNHNAISAAADRILAEPATVAALNTASVFDVTMADADYTAAILWLTVAADGNATVNEASE